MTGARRLSAISTHRNALDSTIASLRFAGLWINYGKSASAWEIIYKIYNKLVIAIICIFAVTVFADLCANYDDLIILTDDGCILAGICVIIFKIFNFYKNSERIKSIIETVHNPVVVLNRSSDPKVRVLVRTCSFYEKLLLHGFWSIGTFLSVALIFLVPVEEGELPIRAQYPFDVGKFPMYHIAFCLQACAVNIGLISIIGMDSIAVGLYKWSNVQLVVLNANYEHCLRSKSSRGTLLKKRQLLEAQSDDKDVPDNIVCFIPFNEKEAQATDDDSFVRRFKICIKHHQRIINSVDELNEIFGASMFVQLFASFSMICFTGFQAVLILACTSKRRVSWEADIISVAHDSPLLTIHARIREKSCSQFSLPTALLYMVLKGSKNFSSLIKFGIYLGAAFSQLLNWCWNGNALVYQSGSLTTSQWLSGWEDNLSPEVVGLMIISLMRSKRALSLKAGKFYTMSMETFIAILRSSYSFFALLTQINETNE